MDTKALIEKLNNVFCNLNKADKKYSEIWLSQADFGGLYDSEKYILNIRADHQIDQCNNEIREIISLLNEKAHDELKYVERVAVYNADDEIHCLSGDVLVYTKEKACP